MLLLFTSFYLAANAQIETLYKMPFAKGYQFWDYQIGKDHLTFSADEHTQVVSSLMPDPLNERTSVVYLEKAQNIHLMYWYYGAKIDSFRYTILENDLKIVAKDTLPSQSSKTKNSYYIDFGKFNITNKKLTAVFYKLGRSDVATNIVFYNQKPKPVEILNAVFVETFDNPPVEIIRNKKNEIIKKSITYNRAQRIINNGYVYYDDKLTEAEIQIKPLPNVFLYKILIRRKIDGKDDIVKIDEPIWKNDWFGNIACKLPMSNFSKAGQYEIVIYPKIGNTSLADSHNQSRLRFEIKIQPNYSPKQVTAGIILFSLIIGSITGVTVVYLKNKQAKKKIAAEAKQKEIAQLQLNAVRSQLNPHFLFNALAGIQNLMNKNEIDHANRYLSKFARLTRNVLDSKELISLSEEKTLLDDYLQMEQLRFGFQYKINASADLDTENIEIPAMLLQPFVENAVKHGIAGKKHNGEVEINFNRTESDLVLTIFDNGTGFDATKTYQGFGLALSKNRISLLNTLYKGEPFVLNIQSDGKGTTVTITLSDWL